MKKRFNINITESAKKDILEIIDYYRKTIKDLEAAKKFIYKIKDKFSLIAVYPKCYPLIKNEHVKDKNIRKVVLDNYIIFYIIDNKNKTIMILRILMVLLTTIVYYNSILNAAIVIAAFSFL